MVAMNEIREISRRIAEEFHPERIVLFGSYARGQQREESDVDLLVVMPFRGPGVRKAVEILDTVKPRMAVDLIVRTPRQARQRLSWNDWFLREVLDEGELLYESAGS